MGAGAIRQHPLKINYDSKGGSRWVSCRILRHGVVGACLCCHPSLSCSGIRTWWGNMVERWWGGDWAAYTTIRHDWLYILLLYYRSEDIGGYIDIGGNIS